MAARATCEVALKTERVRRLGGGGWEEVALRWSVDACWRGGPAVIWLLSDCSVERACEPGGRIRGCINP
jgi:hypothetical protein